MATVDSISSYSSALDNVSVTNDNSVLGKDDFMQLLLTELQYQDPTSPMDSDKILQQTSQLATLEAQQNANTVMEELSASFQSTLNFSAISAIGKTAILTDQITLEEGSSATFPLDFVQDVSAGTITIYDTDNNLVAAIPLDETEAGVHSYTWDGTDSNGEAAASGSYTVAATYLDADGESYTTSVGTYKIESIAFEDGVAYAKLGGQYIPFESIVEVTE